MAKRMGAHSDGGESVGIQWELRIGEDACEEGDKEPG